MLDLKWGTMIEEALCKHKVVKVLRKHGDKKTSPISE